MNDRIAAIAIALSLALAAGCGAGTAGILSNDDDGDGGPAPALTTFQVVEPKVSPVKLVLEASVPVTAELFFERPGHGESAMGALTGDGVSGNRVQLAAGPNELEWDFAAEPGGGPGFVSGVDLSVRYTNGAPIDGGSLSLGLGNDPPLVLSVDPVPTDPSNPAESSGNVELRLAVSDSSSDVVAIEVEWRRADDASDAWSPATAAGVFPGGVETEDDADGVSLSFFWNTNVDLEDAEDDVLVRVIADDETRDSDGLPIGRSAPVVSELVHVDNNEEPIVQLLNDAVIANSDERRGIPVPVRVLDEEGDPVELILQWRHDGEEFPALPEGEAALDAVLADPAQRRAHHVCTPFPVFAEGHVVPIDASRVRLPELASSESWALAYGLEGQTLELLRPSSIPVPITPTWSANPLAGPIAAVPVGDGRDVLVLDAPGSSWRLRTLELSTGSSGPFVATGPGAPSAMALERGEAAALVAAEASGGWRLERVALADGATTTLAVSDGSEPGPVRDIASRGSSTAFFTAGSSLFQIDYGDPLAPRLARVLTDLAEPSGVAFDPVDPDRCYVAERAADRVLVVDLATHERSALVVRTADGQPSALVGPTALAFERERPRLLVVTAAPGGGAQLVGIDPGARGANAAVAIGGPWPSGIGAVSSGPDGLRLATLPGAGELLVAGGVAQRRIVRALDPQAPDEAREQLAVVEPPFDPPPAPSQPWRVALGPLVHATSAGVVARFAWDSADAHTGSVFLRVLGRDDERGAFSGAKSAKTVRHGLEVEPVLVEGSAAELLALADFDDDGDGDVVGLQRGGSAGDTLTLYLQEAPRSARMPPVLLVGPGVLFDVAAFALGDLDADRDLDVAVATFAGGLAILFQDAPASFGPRVDLAGSASTLALGDLDGDGDLDLFAAGGLGTSLYLQQSPGVFAGPSVLDPQPTTFGDGVALGDLDGDGDLDALIGSRVGPTVFFQDAPGVFGAARTLPIPPVGGLGWIAGDVEIGDLDGDGDQDLAVLPGPTLYLQVSPGEYAAPAMLSSLGGGPFVGFDLGDLDGDRDQDIWVPSSSSDTGWSVFFQDGAGAFTPSVVPRPRYFSALLDDLDGDGAADLIGTQGQDVELVFQSVPGGFLSHGLPTSGLSGGFAIGDVDDDGDRDFVSVDAVFAQGAPRSFVAPVLLQRVGLQPELGDLDGDGDLDLLSVSRARDGDVWELTVTLQSEPGRLGESLVLGRGYAPALGDLDCDGDLDIAAANQLGVQLFLQDAGAAWSSSSLSLPDGALGLALGDLDGDGDADIAAGTGFPDLRLALFFQDCPGGFTRPPRMLPGFAGEIGLGDMNGDGAQDIVSLALGEQVRIHFQGTAGTFDAPPLVLGGAPAVFRALDLALGDLDGDRDQDIVVLQPGGNSPSGVAHSGLVALYQASPGAFGAARPLGAEASVSSIGHVEIVDFDGDGEPDVVASMNGETVLWGGD